MSDVTLQNYSDDSSIKKYIQQQLMPRVFKDIPLSVLNTGSFNIISEYLSQTTEQLAFTSTFYFNESFITKAVLPDSIYAEAAIFDIGYAFATPSCTEVLLELRISDLLSNSTMNEETGHYEFILDKNTQFNLPNGNVYSLDYDIQIEYMSIPKKTLDDSYKEKGTSDDQFYNWSVTYLDMGNNCVAVNKNKYIVYRVTDTWLCLFVKVSEYKRTKYLVTNSSTNGIPNEDYLIQISDHICGFDVTYIDTDGTRTPLRQDHILPIHGDVNDLQPYVHYIMDNPNTIRLMFQMAGTRFHIPKMNSQYEIIVYTCHGAAANFTSAPNVQPNVINATTNYANNGNVMKAGFIISGSLGGADIGNANTVRRETIEAYNTANVISTDHDIDEWFKTFYFKNILYPYFYKRRDDPWGRMWSGFLALKDDNDDVYRTNTLNGVIPYSVLEKNGNGFSNNELIIPPGWAWTYQSDSRHNIEPLTLNSNLVVETARTMQLSNSLNQNTFDISKNYVFANPFGIRIQKDPFAIAYFNPWVNLVVAPTRVEKMNTISAKDQNARDVASLYHASPIDVEICRNYKEDCYRMETYIDPSQLKTFDGEDWVTEFSGNVSQPEIDDIYLTYFKEPRDYNADVIPMMIRTIEDGALGFDPYSTYLCVRMKTTRSDNTITLGEAWIQDNTDENNPKTIDISIPNTSYIFGLASLWGEDGDNEPISLSNDTTVTCSGMDEESDFLTFGRNSTNGYYTLKINSDMQAYDETEQMYRPISISRIRIITDTAVKSERSAYNESALYYVGHKYRRVVLNIQFEYSFVEYVENEDGTMSRNKVGGLHTTQPKAYAINNAVNVLLPYDTDVEPSYSNNEYVFDYPCIVNADDVDNDLPANTIIAYATMRPEYTNTEPDYYRIPLSELYQDIPLFYLKATGLDLTRNNMRVVMHAYVNGAETGHVEMLPVKRDTDGTYLFKTTVYPMNELVDLDNMIHIATRDVGGGSWIPTKEGTVADIDSTKPEFRISILFKSSINKERVSDITVGDTFTGYILADQYYVNNFSLIQELKEMRSVVDFDESSIPSAMQMSWYKKFIKQYQFISDTEYSLYQIKTTIEKILSTKVFPTEGEARLLSRQAEYVQNSIVALIENVCEDSTILPYKSRVLLRNTWNRISTALDVLKDCLYYDDTGSNERLDYDGTETILCYAKRNEPLTEEVISYQAYEQFKEDHPQFTDETSEDYEERMEERYNEHMKTVYEEEVRDSSNQNKNYEDLYYDEDCTRLISTKVGVWYCVNEEESVDTIISYVKTGDIIQQVKYNNRIVWEHIYDVISDYPNMIDDVFTSINVNGGVTIQLMPVVEYSLMNSDKFEDFVKTFTQVHKAIEPVIFKRLEGNHYLDCKLVGTYGLSNAYCPDTLYNVKNAYWPNLSVQISFDVKLYNRALTTNTLNELRTIVKKYFNRLSAVHTPKRMITMENNLYVSHLIQEMEAHDNVAYMKFNGWYTNQKNTAGGYYMGPEVQAIVQKWAKIEDMDYEELEKYVPEMFIVDEANIEINVIDDHVLA